MCVCSKRRGWLLLLLLPLLPKIIQNLEFEKKKISFLQHKMYTGGRKKKKEKVSPASSEV